MNNSCAICTGPASAIYCWYNFYIKDALGLAINFFFVPYREVA